MKNLIYKIAIVILFIISLTNLHLNNIILDRCDRGVEQYNTMRTLVAAVLAENLELRAAKSKEDFKTIADSLARLDVLYAEKIKTFKKLNMEEK